MSITTAKELGQAIKEEKDTIEIEGDLCNKVIKIKATGTVAWGVWGALGIAIGTIIVQAATTPIDFATLGASASVKGFVATSSGAVAATTLGSATTTAILIGVAGGGVGTLNKLRGYRLEKVNDKKIVLHRK